MMSWPLLQTGDASSLLARWRKRALLTLLSMTLLSAGAAGQRTGDAQKGVSTGDHAFAQTVPASKQTKALEKQLGEIVAAHHGKVAVWAKNLETGQVIAIDADEPVQTASVIKLPIMLEAFHQKKAGKLDLAKRIRLMKDDQVSGSGVLPFLDPGLDLTVNDAIVLMMTLSDNTATNLVIDQVTIPAVNARISALGLKDTYLYKKVYKPPQGPMPADQKKFGLGKTTAREMGEVMEAIARCELRDAELCKRMVEIMKNQQFRYMIPRYLETEDTSEEGSAIADKIGELDHVRNDVALVESKAGPIVISIFTWDNADASWSPDNEAYFTIAKLAREIVHAWSPQGLGKPK
jgi:beta-lactamase class A